MKTIDRNDTEQQAIVTEQQILDTRGEDSFLSSDRTDVDRTELRSSNPIVTVDRQQKTLYQKILLTILPFVLLPVGSIGWMAVHKIATPDTISTENPLVRQERAKTWIKEILYLLALGSINLGAALWVSRRMSNSFNEIATKLNDAASGNLSTQIAPGDTVEYQAVADNFNQLVANFNYTLQQQQLAAEANKLFGKLALIAQESLDPLQVYQTATSEVNQVIKADRVSVYRCDPDWIGVVVAESARAGIESTVALQVGKMYFADSVLELERYQRGQSFAVSDLRMQELSPNRQNFVNQLKLKSLMLLPIVAGKQLVGLLSVQQSSRVRQWATWEVDFCTQTAQRMGLAVEQIATWTTQSAELQRTKLLSQAIQIRQPEELTNLLEHALESVRQEFKLDRVMIFSLANGEASRTEQRYSGRIAASVTKPGCLPLDEGVMTDYLLARLAENHDRDDEAQISNIYSILPDGGLTGDEIGVLQSLQIQASLVAPILYEGRLLGLAIGQMCESARIWQQSEVDKFTTFTSQLGSAIDRDRALAQQEITDRQQHLLSQITLQLRQSLDRDAIIDTALTSIRQGLGLDRAIFYTLDERGNGTIIAESLASDKLSLLGKVIDCETLRGISTDSLERDRINAIDDINLGNLPDALCQMMKHCQVRANIIIPVLVENKLFGAIGGHMCQNPRTWQASEVDLLIQISTQMGLVLSQAQLVAQRENNARKLQSLSNFTLQLRQSLKRQDILNTAVELVRQTLDLDRAIIFELDRNFNGKIVAESVLSDELAIIGRQIDDCCIKSAGYELGKTTAFADIYQAGLNDCHLQMLESCQVRANLVVPITIDGQLFGLLIGHQCQEPRAWQADEIGLFNQFATQLALSLNQSTLIEQREVAAKRSQLLSDITIELRQSLDETEILNLALPQIRQVFGLDRTSILVLDDLGAGTIIAESVAAPELSIKNFCFSAEHLAEIKSLGFDRGNVSAIEDLHQCTLSASLTQALMDIHMRSSISTPILIGKKLFGLVTGSMSQTTRQWDRSETDMLIQLAAQVGVALNQAQLVRQLEDSNRQQAEYATIQQAEKESLQKNAWELLLQVDLVSQGDLTVRAHVTSDEIGTIADSYNSTVESLRSLVMGVQKVSHEVVSTTSLNEISVAELSLEALQQSQDVGLALNRLQDMSKSIQLVVNNALVAESAVMESAQLVQAGDEAMNRTVEGILTIRSTVAETAKKVKRLGESSQKISKVVNLISNFAAQTNLLALNASIEAARAGEEGRGFAVVAEEVRSLARQSAEATGEIEKLVASIQSETNDVVTAMEAGTEQVAIGSRLVDETRASLDRVTATSAKIGQLVESIAQAALLQAEDSTHVTQSIHQVANIATKTSIRAEHVQASFQDLLKLARDLQTNIGQFKID
jgi:methyl-accepting chemotaxis protein PixJ